MCTKPLRLLEVLKVDRKQPRMLGDDELRCAKCQAPVFAATAPHTDDKPVECPPGLQGPSGRSAVVTKEVIAKMVSG